jgi:hypothetical protein
MADPPIGRTESLAAALERLAARGFRLSLRARSGGLRDATSGESHAPETLAIAEIVRFEGETDPDEEVVLFALNAADGRPLGTYATMFGPQTGPEDVAVIRRLRRPERVRAEARS